MGTGSGTGQDASKGGGGGGGSGGSGGGIQRHVLRSSNTSLCVQEILGRAKMNTIFDVGPVGGAGAERVVEVGSDGRTLEPVGGRTATELGLHSRDLSIFASDSRLSPQRATIAARGDRVLFRTEAIKAVIERDRCTLIKTKKDRDFHDIIKPMTLVVRAQPEVPFELSVLEVLLHVTLLYFERRRAHIHWLVDRIVGDAAASGGASDRQSEGPLGRGDPFGGIGESTVQQFVPVGKLLTSVLHDARETCDAINRSIGQASPAQRQERLRNQALEDASRILETYLREMESIVGSLLESEDYLESTRETYRMQLDSARNHIILVNLWISVVSISLMVATIPAALFGMNVRHGFEESAAAFAVITLVSGVLAVLSYPAFMSHFTARFLRASREGAWNLRMLRTFLLQHSDDLEAIREALRSLPRGGAGAGAGRVEGSTAANGGGAGALSLSREEFREHMRARLPRSVRLSDGQLDYLFAHIDRDKDGVLSEVEATLSSQELAHHGDGANGNGLRSGGGRGGDGGSLTGLMGSDGELLFEEAVLLVEEEGKEGARGAARAGEQELGRKRGSHMPAHVSHGSHGHHGPHGHHSTSGPAALHGHHDDSPSRRHT
ncbi:hypothetical protein GPECTOR_17g953 [Gonium pectorale]|uniref:Magnesium transporter n=1 Tax=Gonium pectorale TaxID=33097 RepID=A0A150GKJ7_GONPE|nr:hypothetical protein GPECTOR_17g953 [Gonium pectorale]|eukprot:KXZ50314.1 hypothetical protein GPECTOR_17g953 [Gonium pectorale]